MAATEKAMAAAVVMAGMVADTAVAQEEALELNTVSKVKDNNYC